MRILWVGAGASIAAGYPSALRLLATIEEAATTGIVEEGVRASWKRFATFRDTASGTERTLLSSTNPEVVLSVPDLLAAARVADDDRIESDYVTPALHGRRDSLAGTPVDAATLSITGATIEREYQREERRRLEQASHARDALVRVLDYFFAMRHYEDHTAEGYDRRSYLRRELSDLQEGDVVITTNWDTLIERILLEDGRWSPFDGYGFNAHLSPIPPDVRDMVAAGYERTLPTLPSWALTRSAVRVLKIHGSFGWHTPTNFGARVEAPGRVYLDHAVLLSYMPLLRPGVGPSPSEDDLCLLWDEDEPRSYDASDRPLYLYPSYLKQIAGTTLQDIWNEADKAIRSASEIRVLGASLPNADSALHALLNPVRYRLMQGALRVTVDDPSPATHERWRVFLGDAIVSRRRKAGEEM